MNPVVFGAAVAILVVGAVGRSALADEDSSFREPWDRGQGERVLERLGAREPFLASHEAGHHPESLNRFFRQEVYRRLRGNPVYGYWADDGFRWTGRRVAWDGMVGISRCARPIRSAAWDAAFAYIAKKYGFAIDPQAPIRVRGACVAAVTDPNVEEPNRGVVLELRFESPSGRFWYRFGMGKPTLEDAVGASLDWAVGFARTLNRDEKAPKEVP